VGAKIPKQGERRLWLVLVRKIREEGEVPFCLWAKESFSSVGGQAGLGRGKESGGSGEGEERVMVFRVFCNSF